MPVYKNCDCEEWGWDDNDFRNCLTQDQIEEILGTPFRFCPWCGKSLKANVWFDMGVALAKEVEDAKKH